MTTRTRFSVPPGTKPLPTPAIFKEWAKAFQQAASYVRECSDEELASFGRACASHTGTNTGWHNYRAARALGQMVEDEANAREGRRRRTARDDQGVEHGD